MTYPNHGLQISIRRRTQSSGGLQRGIDLLFNLETFADLIDPTKWVIAATAPEDHGMDLPIDWQFWSSIAQGVGGIGSVFASTAVAVIVYRYTNRKDRFEYLSKRWQSQQDLNIAALQDSNLLIASEKLIYGENYTVDIDRARKYFYIFTILNMILQIYIGFKLKIIPIDEYNAHCRTTVRLLKNEESLVIYLLKERGYSEDFSNEVRSLLKEATAPHPEET